jgi:hypothetical protein
MILLNYELLANFYKQAYLNSLMNIISIIFIEYFMEEFLARREK